MHKIKTDLLCNYVSMVVMAVSGLLMNTVIVLFYGSDVLGIYNETYAWYMILSQVAVWGIHMAVLKFVPGTKDNTEQGSILKTSILTAVVFSFAVTVMAETVVFCLGDIAWKKSMLIAFTGLVLLSVNKVLLNYLNATHRMVAYAVFTSFRYGFFGIGILGFALKGVGPEFLAWIFPLIEIAVLIGTILYFAARISIVGRFDRKLFGKIVYFGTKILPSAMVLEMNTKLDVVCLGMLTKDASQIGIYSFAVLFTEGFYMLYVTVRKIINPGIAESNSAGKLKEYILGTKKALSNYMVWGGGLVYAGIAAGYILLCAAMRRPAYIEGVLYILIICLAIAANGKYIIFGDLLAQTGYPFEESVLNMLTVAGNFLLNVIFITLFGTVGAAIATAASHYIFALYMKTRIKKRLGVII